MRNISQHSLTRFIVVYVYNVIHKVEILINLIIWLFAYLGEPAMQTMNSIQLLGNVGQDAEVFRFDDGGRKATVKIATNKGSGDNKKTHWHTLIFYNAAADLVSLLESGDVIAVEGELEYRQWIDQNQQNRFSAEIIVDKFSIIRGEVGQVQNADQNQGGYNNQNNGQNNQNQGGYNNKRQGRSNNQR